MLLKLPLGTCQAHLCGLPEPLPEQHCQQDSR